MLLRCPACTSAIQRGSVALPPGTVYRCAVCRLELIYDPNLNDMRPAPPISPLESKPTVA